MNILIVDDNRLHQFEMARYLRKKGWHVETTCCIDGTMEYLKMLNIDLCFIELQVNDGRGFKLVNEIEKKYPGIDIVPMTRSTTHGFHSGEEIDEKYTILKKPLHLKQLVDLVVQQSSTRKELECDDGKTDG